MAVLTAATRTPLAPFRVLGRICSLTCQAYSPYLPLIILLALAAALVPLGIWMGQLYYRGTLLAPDNVHVIAMDVATIVAMFVAPATLHRRRGRTRTGRRHHSGGRGGRPTGHKHGPTGHCPCIGTCGR